MKDSLTYLNYYNIALWLSGRLEPHVEGSVGPRKSTPEPSYYPKDMQLPEEEQKLLWNRFFRQDKEVVKDDG